MNVFARLLDVGRTLWRVLRALSGDDAYERYVRHQRSHHPGERQMTVGEFVRDRQRRRWSGINRCC